MRLIIGFGHRMWVWETALTPVLMKRASEAAAEDDEDFKSAPVDPHGTVLSHMEISPDAIGLRGKSRFGFNGSEG